MANSERSRRQQNRDKPNKIDKSSKQSKQGVSGKKILVDKGSAQNVGFGEISRLDPIEETFEQKLEKIKNIIMDQIVLKEGSNEIRIELTKRHNRVYRIDIYFNDCEVRPSTYTGTSSAMNYWKLLKGLLK